MQNSDALDLEKDVFKSKDPKKIARSLRQGKGIEIGLCNNLLLHNQLCNKRSIVAF